MAKIYKFREIRKILKRFDARFEFITSRAKGSERMIYHPDINGRPESLPVKCHGTGQDVHHYVVSDIVRRFGVPRSLFTVKGKAGKRRKKK